MKLQTKQWIIAFLSAVFLLSLVFVQWLEVARRSREAGLTTHAVSIPVSSKECVDCHAVPGPDAMALTVASPKHFFRSCHDYAAVKIDCFDCHASRPQPGDLPDDHGESVVGAARE